MGHPFGDALNTYLRRRRGLSQMKLAMGINQDPSVITFMCKGERLRSPQARARIVAMIEWLYHQQALTTVAEANTLLTAAGFSGLNDAEPGEAMLLKLLDNSPPPSQSTPRDMPRSNLPLATTSFIGREHVLGDLKAMLERERLVTLTGTGGAGKTRLALEVTSQLAGHYVDGIWMVELASLADQSFVPQTIATALGVQEVSGQSLLDTVVRTLRQRRMLILLDNCEHVIEACADFAGKVLRACAGVRILATSREALDIPGEQIVAVPPLSMPVDELKVESSKLKVTDDAGSYLQPSTFNFELSTLLEYEAIRLFVERARSIQPAFQLTHRNAPAVAYICKQLDGLPLAVELAAARIRVLTAEQIAERLSDRFRLLTNGGRTTLPRHQTLRALVDWSYDLLTESEKIVFRRLAVFAGGWTLEAAEAICSGKGIEPEDVLDILTRLAGKTLLVVDYGQQPEVRYHLLETIRQYAVVKLEESGEAAVIEQRHSDWFMRLAAQGSAGSTYIQQNRWLHRVETEHDNLRAVYERELGTTTALVLASALGPFWRVRCYWSEGLDWLERAMAYSPQTKTVERAQALYWGSMLAWRLGNVERAEALTEEGLQLAHELHDTTTLAGFLMVQGKGTLHEGGDILKAQELFMQAHSLYESGIDEQGRTEAMFYLGQVAVLRSDLVAGQQLLEQSLSYYRKVEDYSRVADCHNILSSIFVIQEDYPKARLHLKEGLHLYTELGKQSGIACIYDWMGQMALKQGKYTRARDYFEQSLRCWRAVNAQSGIAYMLNLLSRAFLELDELQAAQAAITESLELRVAIGNRGGIAASLEMIASIATRTAPERAMRLFGAAGVVRETNNIPYPPQEWAYCERMIAIAKQKLDDQTYEAAYTAGKSMSLEQAIDYALNDEDA